MFPVVPITLFAVALLSSLSPLRQSLCAMLPLIPSFLPERKLGAGVTPASPQPSLRRRNLHLPHRQQPSSYLFSHLFNLPITLAPKFLVALLGAHARRALAVAEGGYVLPLLLGPLPHSCPPLTFLPGRVPPAPVVCFL